MRDFNIAGAILASAAVWLVMLAYSPLSLIMPQVLMSVIDHILVGLFTVLPISLHIAMFICVRRHNRTIQDLNHPSSQQLSACLQREKRVARSMAVITLILLILLLPNAVVLGIGSPFTISMLFPWTTTLSMLTSSLNPVIHLWRDERLRNAVRCCPSVWNRAQPSIRCRKRRGTNMYAIGSVTTQETRFSINTNTTTNNEQEHRITTTETTIKATATTIHTTTTNIATLWRSQQQQQQQQSR